ncbi:acetyltransferase [Verrucomicrobia bacterium SCGC AG-212-E04]|nr:acetyltransferase [Verrucomicrobia bacterium SCGC AG-212-E04]
MPRPKTIPARLESKRLIMRVPVPSDATVVNAAIRASLPQLKKWMPWAQKAPTLAETHKRLCEEAEKFRQGTDIMLLLFAKETGELVGCSGLHRIDWSVPRLEIGYWIATRHAGRGYVSEAVRAIDRFAFKVLGAARVEILCDHRNAPSRRVAERVGYQLEAVLRHQRRDVRGRLTDMCIFARTRRRK